MIKTKSEIVSILKNNYSTRDISFYLGTLFLPSALPISGIFYLIALLLSIKDITFNKFDLTLFVCSGWMIFSNIRILFFQKGFFSNELIFNSWIGLFNWIPLFLLYLVFQSFFHKKNREIFIYILLIGTVPVIASCIAQEWFKLYGPFSTMNGLITWFQPRFYIDGSLVLTGLFSNPNYAALWLSTMLPFSLYVFRKRNNDKFLLVFSLLIAYFIFLTESRNGLLSLLISIFFLLKLKILLYIFIIVCLSLILIYLLNINAPINLEILMPINLFNKIINLDFINQNSLGRIEIYTKTLTLIKNSPILGWGAGAFSFFFITQHTQKVQHAHNMPLELAFNFGVPLSIMLTGFVTLIIFRAIKIIFFNREFNKLSNKSWLAATLIILIFNFSDVPYYDGKISLLSWILLAGLSCIIKEYDSKYKNQKNLLSKIT